MAETPIYNLFYVTPGLDTSTVVSQERVKFETIESNMQHLFDIFGNGVIETDPSNPSWHLLNVSGSSTQLQITPGQGHVGWKYAETTTVTNLTIVIPPTIVSNEITVWIYATPDLTTPNKRTISFIYSFREITEDVNNFICIGTGIIKTVNGLKILDLSNFTNGRVEISLFNTIATYINKHVHIGGRNNPSQINLASHVQNKLYGEHIGNFDASQINQGQINPNVLPQYNHDDLLRRGTLTHTQIESLLSLSQSDSRLSDLTTANTLQTILALKRYSKTQTFLSTIDYNLINTLIYIPGITNKFFEANLPLSIDSTPNTPNNLGDVDPNTKINNIPVLNRIPEGTTLATIDKINNIITGTSGNTNGSNNIIWTTDVDFQNAILGDNFILSPITKNCKIIGSGSDAYVTIDKPINYLGIASSDMTGWESGTNLTDLSGISSATPPPFFIENINESGQGLRRYLFLEFTQENWFSAQKIGIGYKIDAGTPGDIFMFLILPNGTNESMVLKTNVSKSINVGPTVKLRDSTELQSPSVVYREFNLLELVNQITDLNQVLGLGFYYQTATGWDTKNINFKLAQPTTNLISYSPLELEIINRGSTSSIFIWNQNLYADSATIIFRRSSILANTNYNAVISDYAMNSISSVLNPDNYIGITTRVSDLSSDLESTTEYKVNANSLISGTRQGNFIDIIVRLTPSLNRTESPILKSIILSYTASTQAQNILYSASDLINNWSLNSNNVSLNNNFLIIKDTSKIGRYVYVENNSVYTKDSLGNVVEYADTANLYPSPIQLFNNYSRGLKTPKDYIILENNNILIADTDNDRIIELSEDGNLVRAIQSNLRLQQIPRDFVALLSVYNPTISTMWVCFSQYVKTNKFQDIVLYVDNKQYPAISPDINISLFKPDSNNKSTILQINFSQDMINILNNASVIKINIPNTAVTLDGNDSSTTSSTTATTTNICDNTKLPTFLDNPSKLYRKTSNSSLSGTWFCSNDGLMVEEIQETVGDFNKNGTIDTVLQGLDNISGLALLTVYVKNIYFDNTCEPISLQWVNSKNKIVAGFASGNFSAVAYDNTNKQIWNINNSVAKMRTGLLGNVYEITDSPIGLVLFATPISDDSKSTNSGQIIIYSRVSKQILNTINISGDAVRILPSIDPLKYWVLIDDRLNNGLSSDLIQIDISGRIYSRLNSSTIKLNHPKGLYILENNQVLVSE